MSRESAKQEGEEGERSDRKQLVVESRASQETRIEPTKEEYTVALPSSIGGGGSSGSEEG